MKKRTNMYLDEEDRRIIAFLKERYGLESDASVVRLALRKAAKAEGYISKKKEQERNNEEWPKPPPRSSRS